MTSRVAVLDAESVTVQRNTAESVVLIGTLPENVVDALVGLPAVIAVLPLMRAQENVYPPAPPLAVATVVGEVAIVRLAGLLEAGEFSKKPLAVALLTDKDSGAAEVPRNLLTEIAPLDGTAPLTPEVPGGTRPPPA